MKDCKPLVGGRHYYISNLCDDPYGLLAFLPPNPRTEEIEEEDDDGEEDEYDDEVADEDENENGEKKNRRKYKYKLSPIFDGDIVAPGDFTITNRVEVVDVCKKQNKRKSKKAKQEPPTIVGLISNKVFNPAHIFGHGINIFGRQVLQLMEPHQTWHTQ